MRMMVSSSFSSSSTSSSSSSSSPFVGFMRKMIRMVSILGSVQVVSVVAAFNYMENPYQEPNLEMGDQRSPCPALNTLANHGFISRNGQDISISQVALAAANVFSMSNQSISFVIEKMISVGLPHRMDTENNDILFDMDDTHVVDHDLSASWLDRTYRTVREVNPCIIDTLMDRASGSDYITPDMIEDNLRQRYIDSKMYNPNFKFTEHTVAIAGVQSAELFVVSNDITLQTVNKTVLYEFLRYNRLVPDYQPRATTNPFQPKLNNTDPSSQLIMRYQKVLEELFEQPDSQQPQSDYLNTNENAICIKEQPPAPPTMAPIVTPTSTPPMDTDSSSATTVTAVTSILFFVAVTGSVLSTMMMW